MKRFIVQLSRLQFIFRPSFWLSHGRVCKNWDAKLNALLDHHVQTGGVGASNDANFTINIAGVDVWIGNYPYSYGREWNSRNVFPNRNLAMPRRATRIRLHKIVKEFFASKEMYADVRAAQDALAVEINKLKERK